MYNVQDLSQATLITEMISDQICEAQSYKCSLAASCEEENATPCRANQSFRKGEVAKFQSNTCIM